MKLQEICNKVAYNLLKDCIVEVMNVSPLKGIREGEAFPFPIGSLHKANGSSSSKCLWLSGFNYGFSATRFRKAE